jgi:hypothetical protein
MSSSRVLEPVLLYWAVSLDYWSLWFIFDCMECSASSASVTALRCMSVPIDLTIIGCYLMRFLRPKWRRLIFISVIDVDDDRTLRII